MDNFTEQDDQWLRDTLHGVSSPVGLRERIRSRLQQEVSAQTPSTLGVQPDSSHDQFQLSPAATTIEDHRHSRRKWVAVALAVSVSALVVGGLRWSRPASVEQLAKQCLQQLDGVLGEDATWHAEFNEQLSELDLLDGQLRGSIQPIGYQDQSGGTFSQQCRVWKLFSNSTNKAFYVFDFKDARDVHGLNSQLEALNRVSGGWSMVAMQTSGRIVVVLFEGSVDSYLYRQQSA